MAVKPTAMTLKLLSSTERLLQRYIQVFTNTLFYYYYHYCDYKCILTITTCCQADAGSLLPRRDISIVALLAPISHKQMHLSLFTISPILPLTTHRRRAINAEEEQFIFIACNHSKHPRGLSVPPKSGREEAKQPSQPPTPPSPQWVMLTLASPERLPPTERRRFLSKSPAVSPHSRCVASHFVRV